MQLYRRKSLALVRRSVFIVAACLGLLPSSFAQASHADLVLPQTSAARAYAQFDTGELSPSTNLGQLRIVLSQSLARRNAMQALIARQQDRRSSSYHQWISADEYGQQFGASTDDIQKVVKWLTRSGMKDIAVSRGNNFISFSACAGTVARALQVKLHSYVVHGETHYANTTAPVIPRELAGTIAVIQGLDDFTPEPPTHSKRAMRKSRAQYVAGSGGIQSLGPGDLATIYDVNPLYGAGINGSRSTIAVVGAAAPSLQDFQAYKKLFGLSANDFTPVVVPGSGAPATNASAETETALDLEVAGGIAPAARLLYVQDPDVLAAVAYVIDNKLAQIVSMSYTACELPGPEDTAYETLALQGIAEGITWINAAGDSGAAACDAEGSSAAVAGLAVNLPASVPEVTGVGGSSFVNGGSAQSWSQTDGPTGATVAGYVPEAAWNALSDGFTVTAGGGGASKDFFKPGYQASIADDLLNREVPDVALAAAQTDPPYLVIVGGEIAYIGGTSAATPLFAGIAALLNDYLVAHGSETQPGLGNMNPQLYLLQQSEPAAFHDVTIGNNKVGCASGSVDCTDGSLGYEAGPGYDMATGLGSVDAFRLAQAWESVEPGSSAVTLSAGTVDGAGGVSFTASVNAAVNPASGVVIFSWANPAYGNEPTDFARVPVSSDGNAATTFNGLPGGANQVTATFAGTTSLLPAVSNVMTVNITPVPTPTATVALLDAQAQVPAGAYLPLAATVAGTNGPPTGVVNFYFGSTLVGSAGIVQGVAATLSSAPPPAGTATLTARYSGDASYAAATSAPFPLTVVAPTATTSQPPASSGSSGGSSASPDFTLSAPSSVTVAPGSGATIALTVAPIAGFAAPIQFACSGAVSGYSCAAPATVTPSGSTTVMASLQAQVAAFLPILTTFFFRKRRRSVAVAAAGLLLVLAGCGYHATPSAAVVTTAGSYPVTITATSGTLVHTAVVTVNVQ